MNIETVVEDGDTLIRRLELGAWETNAYAVVCRHTQQSVLVDVPPGARTIVKELRGTSLKYILLTHSHIDHFAGLRATRARLPAPVAVHPADNREWLPFPPEILLRHLEVFTAGKLRLQAIHTPGHTPGSTCFRVGNYLLSGDTVFPGGPGRTISPSDFRTMVESFRSRIIPLPDTTRIFPGHGPSTILGNEKAAFEGFLSRSHAATLHGDVVWAES